MATLSSGVPELDSVTLALMIRRVAAALLVVSFAACAAKVDPPSVPTGAPASSGGNAHVGALVVTLSSTQSSWDRDADAMITAVIENRGSKVVEVPSQVVGSSILMIDVVDSTGRRVPTVPPPLPDGSMTSFKPGERATHVLRLGVFSPPLASGDYTIRPRAPTFQGNTLPLHIGL
jgi:hypothetical protein